MLKKLLCGLFSLALVASFVPSAALASPAETSGAADGPYLSVYKKVGDSGEETLVKTYTEAEFKAMVALPAEGQQAPAPVSGMYERADTWRVVSTDNYVRLNYLLVNAGISEQFVAGSSIKFEASDGFASTATYEQLSEQNLFYPQFAGDTSQLGDAVKVPAVLALTSYQSALSDTAQATEQANLAKADGKFALRLIYGVAAKDMTSSNTPMGNRYAKNVSKIVLTTPEAPYFTVYKQMGPNGKPEVVKTYTQDEFAQLKSDSTDPVSGMFFKRDVWNVTTAKTYVTLDDLIADAGLKDLWTGTVQLSYGGDPLQGKKGNVYTHDALMAMNKFFPEASLAQTPVENAKPAPAVLALTEFSGATASDKTAGMVEKENLQKATGKTAPRFICGVSEADYTAKSGNIMGKRYWNNTSSITLIVPEIMRFAGATAYDTMKQIVDKNGKTADTVILASFDGYWDALTASGIAGVLSAPILFTGKDELNATTAELIKSLGAKKVIIAGGTAAVSRAVEKAVVALGPDAQTPIAVQRLGGNDAAGTARMFFNAGAPWQKTAFIATSDGYWDALAAAPFAYNRQVPIFLAQDKVDGANQLDYETLQTIANAGFDNIQILGGTSAVSDMVEAQLKEAGFAGTAERLAGEDAVATSHKIAEFSIANGMSAEGVGVATTGGYWDALAAAALCGSNGMPLALVQPEAADNAAQGFIADHAASISTVFIFGGTAAVPQAASDAIAKVVSGTEVLAVPAQG